MHISETKNPEYFRNVFKNSLTKVGGEETALVLPTFYLFDGLNSAFKRSIKYLCYLVFLENGHFFQTSNMEIGNSGKFILELK